MILADTSAWIEFLRATGSPVHARMRELVGTDRLGVTDPVILEVLVGARDDRDHARLRDLMAACQLVALEGPSDYEDAARLFRRCRRGGTTVRNLLDCLIAVVAMRNDVPVLHADADFDAIAEHAPLRIA
ncbi:MAG TPA: PIN domain nuclease [Thermoleophilaceae bacterium]